MADRDAQAALFLVEASAESIFINGRFALRKDGEFRAVVVAGVVVPHFRADDRMAEAHAMVTLVEQGVADQNDVARAFACSSRTVRRHQRRCEDGGMAQLGRGPGYPLGRPREPASDRRVGRLRRRGQRLGIDEKAVRKRLRRLG